MSNQSAGVSNQSNCVFEPIIAGDAPAHVVLEETDLIAFLDIRPVFPGHTLVVPRRHIETVSDLPPGMAGRLWDAAARVSAAQRTALGSAGTFFGINDVVSQSVPHVHLHVVPRRFKDGLRGFFWPRHRYPSDAEASSVAAAIRDALVAAAPRPPLPTTREARAGVELRDARPDDAPAVAALLAGGSIRANEDPGDPAPYRAAIEEISAQSPGAVLVAEVDGAVVGVCQLLVFRHLQERGGLCAEIESMHVAEKRRDEGIGSALLAFAIERARQAGCYRLQLTSNKVRRDAHRFYLRHGFVASHEGFKLYL